MIDHNQLEEFRGAPHSMVLKVGSGILWLLTGWISWLWAGTYLAIANSSHWMSLSIYHICRYATFLVPIPFLFLAYSSFRNDVWGDRIRVAGVIVLFLIISLILWSLFMPTITISALQSK